MKISRRLHEKMKAMADTDLVLVSIKLITQTDGIKVLHKYKTTVLEQTKSAREAIESLGVENIEIIYLKSLAKCFVNKRQIQRIALISGITFIDLVRRL